jgi:hypothetical protein
MSSSYRRTLDVGPPDVVGLSGITLRRRGVEPDLYMDAFAPVVGKLTGR